jgi:hypothetical protein
MAAATSVMVSSSPAQFHDGTEVFPGTGECPGGEDTDVGARDQLHGHIRADDVAQHTVTQNSPNSAPPVTALWVRDTLF